MSNKTLTPTAINLIKARDLIKDPADWCPEGMGVNGSVFDEVTGKIRRCILVALNDLDLYDVHEERQLLDQAARKLFPDLHYGDIVGVNAKGHDAAMSLYNMAISDAIDHVL